MKRLLKIKSGVPKRFLYALVGFFIFFGSPSSNYPQYKRATIELRVSTKPTKTYFPFSDFHFSTSDFVYFHEKEFLHRLFVDESLMDVKIKRQSSQSLSITPIGIYLVPISFRNSQGENDILNLG